jgi:hypothetical protein
LPTGKGIGVKHHSPFAYRKGKPLSREKAGSAKMRTTLDFLLVRAKGILYIAFATARRNLRAVLMDFTGEAALFVGRPRPRLHF